MSQYRPMLEQLEAGKRRIEEKILSIDPSLYNESPSGERWSVAQALDHVVNVEAGSITYVTRKLSDPANLPAAGLRQTIQNNLLYLALKTKLKFKAPPVVAEPNPDSSVDELLEKWSDLREELATLVAEFPVELENRCVFRHPISGRMNLSQTLRFMVGHLRHHEVQFERIERELSARKE